MSFPAAQGCLGSILIPVLNFLEAAGLDSVVILLSIVDYNHRLTAHMIISHLCKWDVYSHKNNWNDTCNIDKRKYFVSCYTCFFPCWPRLIWRTFVVIGGTIHCVPVCRIKSSLWVLRSKYLEAELEELHELQMLDIPNRVNTWFVYLAEFVGTKENRSGTDKRVIKLRYIPTYIHIHTQIYIIFYRIWKWDSHFILEANDWQGGFPLSAECFCFLETEGNSSLSLADPGGKGLIIFLCVKIIKYFLVFRGIKFSFNSVCMHIY